MRIPWIVLTGGPAGGKSTFLSEADRLLPFQAALIRETARQLKYSETEGPRPKSGDLEFQRRVLRRQLEVEAQLASAPATTRYSAVVLDRGLFDGAAFLGDGQFELLLAEAGLTLDRVLVRYDLILFLESCIPALGPQLVGRPASDPAALRAHAAEVEERLWTLLSGHPNVVRVPVHDTVLARCHTVCAKLEALVTGLPGC